jgi:hypothetical protein
MGNVLDIKMKFFFNFLAVLYYIIFIFPYLRLHITHQGQTYSFTFNQFNMRALNKHPDWYNLPLRLNEEERQNPRLIIENFFECYHLQEVRETLWNWMVEIVSSSRSISQDGQRRNDHIYFYEKMEALVEAAFLINQKTDV